MLKLKNKFKGYLKIYKEEESVVNLRSVYLRRRIR
jgi:hypothetical protein